MVLEIPLIIAGAEIQILAISGLYLMLQLLPETPDQMLTIPQEPETLFM